MGKALGVQLLRATHTQSPIPTLVASAGAVLQRYCCREVSVIFPLSFIVSLRKQGEPPKGLRNLGEAGNRAPRPPGCADQPPWGGPRASAPWPAGARQAPPARRLVPPHCSLPTWLHAPCRVNLLCVFPQPCFIFTRAKSGHGAFLPGARGFSSLSSL